MAELKLKIRYDSYQSLLQLQKILALALKSGFRNCQISQSLQKDTKNKLLIRQIIQFLEKNKFEIKFNFLKISIGIINQSSFYKIVNNMKNCPFVTTISLPNNELNDTSIALLCECNFKFLAFLDLSHNKLTSNSAQSLSKCQWKHLKTFSIGKNRIKNKGIAYLAKSGWQKLKYFGLQRVFMTNEGIKCLVKGNWPQLSCLNISQNHINNQGCRLLFGSIQSKLSFINIKSYPQSDNSFINKNQICKLIRNSKECLVIESDICQIELLHKIEMFGYSVIFIK